MSEIAQLLGDIATSAKYSVNIAVERVYAYWINMNITPFSYSRLLHRTQHSGRHWLRPLMGLTWHCRWVWNYSLFVGIRVLLTLYLNPVWGFTKVGFTVHAVSQRNSYLNNHSWGLAYNLMADVLLQTNIFTSSVFGMRQWIFLFLSSELGLISIH